MPCVLTKYSDGYYTGATDAFVSIEIDAATANTTFEKVSYDSIRIPLTSPRSFRIKLIAGWEPLAMTLLGPAEAVIINEVAGADSQNLFDLDVDPGENVVLWIKGV